MATDISKQIASLYLEGFPESYKNGRGIPRAEFIVCASSLFDERVCCAIHGLSCLPIGLLLMGM
jgi:hypothetical protein